MAVLPSTTNHDYARLKRVVLPELLDELPPGDARAIRSRRDLQRVNAWMGNVRVMESSLRVLFGQGHPATIAEIGAGDGTFLLELARRFSGWTTVSVYLVDRQNLVTEETRLGFQQLGWTVSVMQTDVFAWLRETPKVDLIVANLFLHHFDSDPLAHLLRAASERTDAMVACEPRRFAFSALAGSLVSLIGCNAVTRHDAMASVSAGFRGQEISALWRAERNWALREWEAGWFSHAFHAKRLAP